MTERLYASRPTSFAFDARVLEVRPGGQGGRSEVRLDATLFYPTSGGQPHDTGFLGEARVLDVKEEGESIWHVLDGAAPAAGASVHGSVDEARRRDHREQHSGQHLLSAVLLETLRIPTIAFHLGDELSTIDVKAEKIGRDVLDRVEVRCGELIRRNVAVTATVFTGEAALAQAKTLRKAPEDEALRSPRGLRVVEIAGVDRDACCGTHVALSGELGLVKVLGTERGKKGETRLTFVVGGRALAAFQARQAVLEELTGSLTTGFPDLPARVARIQEAEKASRLEARALREEVLAARATTLAAAAAPLPGGGALLLERLSGGDAGDARVLATKLVAVRKDLVCAVAHEGDKTTVVLARGEAAPPVDLGAALKEVLGPLGGKGGGQGAFVQGAAPAPGKGQEALALAEKALRR